MPRPQSLLHRPAFATFLLMTSIVLIELPQSHVPQSHVNAAQQEKDTTERQAINADTKADEEIQLKFAFRYQPWKDVIEWFATQANLSLQMDAPPAGTCNYTDRRSYTPGEALDVMNGLLLTKGYTLIRRNQTLFVVNLEDGIPDILVPTVSVDDLDNRGEFELAKCLFPLKKLNPDDAETEIGKLIGPQGKLTVLPSARQAFVQETVGKLRTIRNMLDKAQTPTAWEKGQVTEITLEHVTPEELLTIARPLLGLEEGQNANDQIRIAVDLPGFRLFVAGTPEMLQQFEQIVPRVDKELANATITSQPEQLQLESFSIEGANPDTTLQVLQTLLAGLPGVRMTLDPNTNKVIALATPSQHKTIAATLEQLSADAKKLEVISLKRTTPATVALLVAKLWPLPAEGEESEYEGPVVDGDATSMKLWIRGTQSEIDQIRDLVAKLEGDDEAADANRSTLRLIPFADADAESVLNHAELLWPGIGDNRIRIVTPSALTPSMPQMPIRRAEEQKRENVAPPEDDHKPEPAPDTDKQNTQASLPVPDLQFVSFQKPNNDTADLPGKEPFKSKPADAKSSDIVVTVTAAGIMISSQDLDALDRFEQLLREIMAARPATGQPTVFFLKYAKAESAATLVKQILGIKPERSSGDPVDALGDMAGAMGANLFGGLLGLGGDDGLAATGEMTIVPDTRLNALIVKANMADMSIMQRLLTVIDRESSPEDVQTSGKPRLIPLIHTSAEDMMAIVKAQYADRLMTTSSGNRNQQNQRGGNNSAEQLRRLFGGGGGGGRGGGNNSVPEVREERPKLVVGVDSRSNSLIVTAPEPLFQEVKALVTALDQAGFDSTEVVRVVSPQNATVTVIQKSLQGMFGDAIQTTTTPSASNTSASRGGNTGASGTSSNRSSGDNAARNEIRNLILERLRQRQSGEQNRPDGAQEGTTRGGNSGSARRTPTGRPGGR